MRIGFRCANPARSGRRGETTDNRTTELLPCALCGSKALLCEMESGYGTEYAVCCNNGKCRLSEHPRFGHACKTEAEAIAAWNTRTPIEYDGWFYLPKPKEGVVVYGEPEITRTENGYKVKTPVEVIDGAIRSWSDELGDYVMKRMCEAWNTRHVETCENESLEFFGTDSMFKCSVCDEDYPDLCDFNYCPFCGRKVVDNADK